jgi:uncharacterized protein (DUF58 family)
MKTATLIKPEHLAGIRNLSLRARLIVEGYMAGLHKSPFHGFSVEFLEYRPYLPGESTRAIDWRKFARTDKAVVKLFEDETNLRAHLLIDKSASMNFCSAKSGMSKLDYAKTLAAALAWILIRQRDGVGLAAFDESLSTMLPPRSSNIQLQAILAALDGLSGGAATRCGAAINAFAAHVAKRGLCVIFSDLFDDPAQIAYGLRHLRFKEQDVIMLQILDPLELSFRAPGRYRFHDLETHGSMSLDGEIASRYFRDGMENHRRMIDHAVRELGVDFEIITTDEPFQKALFRILEKRRRLL